MNNTAVKKSFTGSLLFKVVMWVVGTIVVLLLAVYIAFQVSPWPSALLIRSSFNKGGVKMNEDMAKFVPSGITSKMDIRYDPSGDDTFLDIYYPGDFKTSGKLYPVIVWTHGGAFIAGDKKELENYCKILASKGFVVAAVNYTLAPGGNYPLPVKQVNSALEFLVKNSKEYFIDANRIILAGDSGGAHISAQLAAIISDETYSKTLGIKPSVTPDKLKGVVLFCGPYSAEMVNFEGAMGGFLKTVLWSYIGKKDFLATPEIKHFSVLNYVTPSFPKTFISVGNHDPLGPHSHALVSKLTSMNVPVDTLFFPSDYSPGLEHEYQLVMNDAGKIALERTVKFINSVSANTNE